MKSLPCFFSALNSLLFVYVRQVVETNLVAFDCHWILINEVSVKEITCGSWIDFCEIILRISLSLQMGTFFAALGFWKREQSLQSFGFL